MKLSVRELHALQGYRSTSVDQFNIAGPVVGMNARKSFPMFGSDGFEGPFRIPLSGEFSDLVESEAVAVGRSAALAGPDQAIVTAKDTAGAAVPSDVSRNGIRKMKMPIPGERCRIEQQKTTSARTWLGAGGCEPP